jgi:hypothetical protein
MIVKFYDSIIVIFDYKMLTHFLKNPLNLGQSLY